MFQLIVVWHIKFIISCKTANGKPNFFQSDGGKQFISVDACFGLPRKKASGTSYHEPLSGKMYFYNQKDVDDFLSSYPKSSKELQQSKVL